MFTFAVMLAAGATLPNYNMPAAKPVKCAGACANRYRVPGGSDNGYSIKDRAVADDGGKCDVVGARRCSSPTRTILRSTEDPIDTWRAAMGDN